MEVFGVKGRADDKLTFVLLGMMKRSDPFSSPSVLFFVIESAVEDHFKAGITDGISIG